MKALPKLAITAVTTVITAALSAIFIPQPWGIIVPLLIGIAGGLYMRSMFDTLKY